jgi:hypothetical protein
MEAPESLFLIQGFMMDSSYLSAEGHNLRIVAKAKADVLSNREAP